MTSTVEAWQRQGGIDGIDGIDGVDAGPPPTRAWPHPACQDTSLFWPSPGTLVGYFDTFFSLNNSEPHRRPNKPAPLASSFAPSTEPNGCPFSTRVI